MPARGRTKFSRARGQRWHGWGAKKKHRGAGNRGGRGMAGSGKRADQKKPTILKLYGNEYFGRHGFSRLYLTKKIKCINLKDLQEKLDYFVKMKAATKTGDIYSVDLEKLGYQKLLGAGNLNIKLKVSVDNISESAARKIEEAGGSVVKKDEHQHNK